jgi:poly-gamma-glutamate capsule biosynthesis protein CapA/YwtB (metallophosphatase superfamily)
MGCGDVGPIHEPMARYGELVKDTLAAADIRFAQCERVYSERGAYQVHSNGRHSRVVPGMASIFSDCNFDVVSVASNHGMDWGDEALLDSISLLKKQGRLTIGAGRDLQEARRPALIERNGVRVAFLAYCSVLNEGYAAGEDKAGIAPLRVHSYYEPAEYQPGVPPRVITVPYENDLQAMIEDIETAKRTAHAVVVSLHWGVHYIPRMIADYQYLVAKAAFTAGADLILGHHAHIPKAIGVFTGKVCFYSLSNFMMSSRAKSPASAGAFERRYGVKLDPDYPNLAYGEDAKRSMIAKAVITAGGVQSVSFLPVLIDKQLRPEVLLNGDPRFADAVRYMDWASEGHHHNFSVQGNEVVIDTAKAAP